MYGLVYLEEPINVGSTELVCPKAIHAIKVDNEKGIISRMCYGFEELDTTCGIDVAYQEALSAWKKNIKEFNSDFSDVENLVFIEWFQYSSFFCAKGESRSYLDLKECFVIPSKCQKHTAFTSVGKSGAENVWNMYLIFKKMSDRNLENVREIKRKSYNKKILHKRASVSFVNEYTGLITKQIESMCDKLGMEVTEENGVVNIATIAGDWKFNALARPTILYKRNSGKFTNQDYHVELEGIYSPLEAIIFIKERDEYELAVKLRDIPKLKLEENYKWI